MRIVKKVQQKYFTAVREGRKPFEVRLADFRCRPGDVLVLKERRASTKKLTGRKTECEVLYKLNVKEAEKFYTKKQIVKYGLVILGVRKKFKYK